MLRRPALLAAAVIASLAMTAAARAQGGSLELRSASASDARVDAGAVLTSVFAVKNTTVDTIRAQPAITVPRGWTIVMGTAPVVLAPGASDTWLVGFAVPAVAPAEPATIHAGLAWAGHTVTDSIVIRVNERRAIEVVSIDVPGWVMAGSRYEARFLVRNRGNVASGISLTGATSRGVTCNAMPSSLTLAPGASATVTVRVAMTNAIDRTTDDVLELTAVDKSATGIRATASTRTTVVSNDEVSRFATVPAMLSLRSIGGASGVAPVALAGGGLLADNKTSVDFSLQSPVSQQSPYGFGERDEYRVNFKANNFSLRLGDNPYGFSPLTSSGMMGTGAEFQGTSGELSGGAYAQKLRWFPGENFEEGAFVGIAPDSQRQLSATVVQRQSAGGAVSVGSIGGRMSLLGGAELQTEIASSDSDHAAGLAERARLSGMMRGVSYDLGVLNGNASFAGLARGTLAEDGALSMKIAGPFTVGASGSVRVSNFAIPLSGIPAQRFTTASVNASYGGLATLEYGWLTRRDDGELTAVDGTQRGLRATTSLPMGPASISVSYERGIVDAATVDAPRAYNIISVSAQMRLGDAGNLSVFGEHDDGNTLTGASSGVANAGIALDLRLPHSFELSLSTSAQRATLGVFDGSGAWFSQSDARIGYRFDGGQSLSLHERIWQNPLMQGSTNTHAIYLEFRTPVKLPVGPSRSAGRAEGIILDADTGKPLTGALVRLGDQAAITDKNGHVAFSGLSPDRQRVSVDATGAASGDLLAGDTFVDIPSNGNRPAKFALSVVRGGTVHALVSRLASAGGTLGADADSLVNVGIEANVLVALESGRDTIYQSSDDRGRIDFGAVAPGTWTLVVMPSDLPDHHVFQADRVVVSVAPGERRDVELKLVPQRRSVTFVGNEIKLKAKQLP